MSINRHEWAQALRGAHELSTTARLLGQSLAMDFANAATGQCNPSRATLASRLGVSEATIKRALSDLFKAGWLSRSRRTARNKTVSYTFIGPEKVLAFARTKPKNAGHARPTMKTRTGVKFGSNAGQFCTSPYKGKNQVKNQNARKVASCPVNLMGEVEPNSHREVAWNEWLSERDWPSVAELGVPSSTGWRMPFSWPPGASDQHGIKKIITERFLKWAHSRTVKHREATA